MLKYIVKRILQMIPMMIILSIVVFCMVRLIPGDPVTMSLGMGAGKECRFVKHVGRYSNEGKGWASNTVKGA